MAQRGDKRRIIKREGVCSTIDKDKIVTGAF
jgi:hypothetical protein